ncbi:MAG: aldehyde dehydrogenase family protein [Flavobacteriaceae bacterium]|nr:aldehyde dehydrogenase family protein [Flavobacteriaceae bacterium]
MQDYPIYLAGTFIRTSEKLEVNNPYTQRVFATTYVAGKLEIEQAIIQGKAAEKVMRDMPIYKRYEILMQIAQGLQTDKLRLAQVLAQESGKPMRYALGELDRAIQTFIIAAEECKRIPGEYFSIDWTPSGHGKEGLVKYVPVGLIAGISPFNFPLNLAVHKIAPAIASGNPIILKPARSTPLSVLELAKIIDQTDLPKGAISLFPTDREAGNQLVTDERIKKLTFTGSPEVGWKMKKEAGNKKITLELGGNAGVIVSQDTDIAKAVQKCLVGSFAYSGQVCIHVQRIYVQEKVFDNFIELFKQGTDQLKFGDPLQQETDISAMIDETNAIRVENWVNDAVSDGALVLSGGKRKGTYYEPTIITQTKPMMNVCALEVFGPVVTVEKYSDFKDAVHQINQSQYGLQAGVFTNAVDEINYAFNELEVGGVIHNDVPTFRVDHMPYGGVKNSGYGREGVKYAMMEMMEPRLLVKEK